MKRVLYRFGIVVFFVFMMNTIIVCGTESKTKTQETVRTGKAETESTARDTRGSGKEETESEPLDVVFRYIHDPRDNPDAMKDIVENSDAVYGFSPSPDSDRLEPYKQYDWTDRKVVADIQKSRREYHKSKESMMDILYKMRDEGASIEEMARAVSKERNRLRLESYKDDPMGLQAVKESNLKSYGHEDGPTPDELYEKYGSWEEVLRGAFSTNMGMDACCGLYDEYYWLYQELGYVK